MSATSLWDNSVILTEDCFESFVLSSCRMFPFVHTLQILEDMVKTRGLVANSKFKFVP